jgi:hypothetical protein
MRQRDALVVGAWHDIVQMEEFEIGNDPHRESRPAGPRELPAPGDWKEWIRTIDARLHDVTPCKNDPLRRMREKRSRMMRMSDSGPQDARGRWLALRCLGWSNARHDEWRACDATGNVEPMTR